MIRAPVPRVMFVVTLIAAVAVLPVTLGGPAAPFLGSARSVVLLVGDTTPGSFGYAAMTSVSALGGPRRFDVITAHVHEPSGPDVNVAPDGTDADVRRALLDRVARGRIVAIVAATPSLAVAPILEVGGLFSIPVLLTVASADRLNGANARMSIVRLIATDSVQMEALAAELLGRSPGIRKAPPLIAVFHDPGPYGQRLYRLLHAHEALRFAPFPLDDGIEPRVQLASALAMHPKAIVFLGHQHQAEAFLVKRRFIAPNVPVFLSDGALGITRPEDFGRATWFMVPSLEQGDSAKFGFGALTAHAVRAIGDAIDSTAASGGSARALRQLVPTFARSLTSPGPGAQTATRTFVAVRADSLAMVTSP